MAKTISLEDTQYYIPGSNGNFCSDLLRMMSFSNDKAVDHCGFRGLLLRSDVPPAVSRGTDGQVLRKSHTIPLVKSRTENAVEL